MNVPQLEAELSKVPAETGYLGVHLPASTEKPMSWQAGKRIGETFETNEVQICGRSVVLWETQNVPTDQVVLLWQTGEETGSVLYHDAPEDLTVERAEVYSQLRRDGLPREAAATAARMLR